MAKIGIWRIWLAAVAFAVIALAILFFASANQNSAQRTQVHADVIELQYWGTEPRIWRGQRLSNAKQLSADNRLTIAVVPDTRTFLERIRDEYQYQKRKLGW